MFVYDFHSKSDINYQAFKQYTWLVVNIILGFGDSLCYLVSIGICSNSPILNGRLLFWEDGSRPSGPFWNLPFWDDPDLNVRYLWVFQVDHSFYIFNVKILAANNGISCVYCLSPRSSISAWDPCHKKHLLS